MKKNIVMLFIFVVVLIIGCGKSELPPEPSEPSVPIGEATAALPDWAADPAGKLFVEPETLVLEPGEEQGQITVSVGDQDFIYKKMFIYTTNGWTAYTFPQEAYRESNWIRSSAEITLEINKEEFEDGDNYFVAYGCKFVDNEWDCNGGKWMLQTFNLEIIDDPDESEAYCGQFGYEWLPIGSANGLSSCCGDDEKEYAIDSDDETFRVCCNDSTNFISVSGDCVGIPATPDSVGELEAEISTCEDSDSGKKYYLRGETKGKNEQGLKTWGYDGCVCLNSEGEIMDVSPVDQYSCPNDYSLSLAELYCSPDGIFSRVTYECPNGCSDGACLEASEKDLLLYLSFNEESGNIVYDKTEFKNNGTVYGAVLTDDKISGKALSFDGINDYITVNNDKSLNPSSFTVEAWVKINSFHTGVGEIVAKGNDDAANGYYGLRIVGNVVHGVLRENNKFYDLNGPYLKRNRWYHLVFTYDGNIQRIYVDGKLEASNSIGVARTSNIGDLQIGRLGKVTSSGSWLYQFNGIIDEVKIYNRALSVSEILRHYNSTAPSGGLLGAWKFDEGSGNIANDASGNSNAGTIYDATFTGDKISGKALSFNGVDNYVDLGLIDFSSTQEFTIEAWVKARDNNGASGIQRCHTGILGVYQGGACGNGDLGIGIDSNNYFYAEYGDGNSYGKFVDGTATLNLNEWYHLTWTFDHGYSVIYVNGVPDGAKISSDVINPRRSFNLGRIEATTFFNGIIDEVRIYKRALRDSEVADLYNSYNLPSSTTRVSTAAYWKFDEGSGNIANDASGNSNAGTINGARWTADALSGNALQFDGNDYVDVSSLSDQIKGASGTIMAWVKPSIVSGNKIIVAFGTANAGEGVGFGINSGVIRVFHSTGAYDWQSQTSINAKEWIHIALTWNLNTEKIYKNGILSGSRAKHFNYHSGSGRIGDGFWNDPVNPFKGIVDEVKIYNGELSEEEILRYYNSLKP